MDNEKLVFIKIPRCNAKERLTGYAVKLSTLAKLQGHENGTAADSLVKDNSKIFKAVTSHVKTTLTTLNDGGNLPVDLLCQMKKQREPLRKIPEYR